MCRDHKIEERETAWNGRETGVNAYSRAWTPIPGRERLYTKNPHFWEKKNMIIWMKCDIWVIGCTFRSENAKAWMCCNFVF